MISVWATLQFLGFPPHFSHSTRRGYWFERRECGLGATRTGIGRDSKGSSASMRINGFCLRGASAVTTWRSKCSYEALSRSYSPSQSHNHVTSTSKVGFSQGSGPNVVVWKRCVRKKLYTFKLWSRAWRFLRRAMGGNCPFAPLEGPQGIVSQTLESTNAVKDRCKRETEGRQSIQCWSYKGCGTVKAACECLRQDITHLRVPHCHISAEEEMVLPLPVEPAMSLQQRHFLLPLRSSREPVKELEHESRSYPNSFHSRFTFQNHYLFYASSLTACLHPSPVWDTHLTPDKLFLIDVEVSSTVEKAGTTALRQVAIFKVAKPGYNEDHQG